MGNTLEQQSLPPRSSVSDCLRVSISLLKHRSPNDESEIKMNPQPPISNTIYIGHTCGCF